MDSLKDMRKSLLVPALIIIVFVVGIGVYSYYSKNAQTAREPEGSISSEDAASKLLAFVNNNILRGQGEASLIESIEENGIYNVKFNVNDQEVEWRITKNGQLIFPQTINLSDVQEAAKETGKTVGDFSVSAEEVCREDGKPVVYFFGSESCPHCVWEKPIIGDVMNKFNNLIVYRENIDTEDNLDIFEKYSTGGIPTLVFGCKYYRVGSGESAGAEQEAKNLTALACKLTGGEPGDVCNDVKDLTESIQ